MARDYKHAAHTSQTREASRVSTGALGLVAGFALGFGTAVMLKIGVKPADTAAKPAVTAPVDTTKTDSTAKEPAKFDFYSMLANFEVVIPDSSQQADGKPVTIEQPGTYVLQVGSFRTAEDAERLKANLALLGIESDIQRVTIDANQVWHRVRIGPFTNLAQLNDARRRLADNDMTALVIQLGK